MPVILDGDELDAIRSFCRTDRISGLLAGAVNDGEIAIAPGDSPGASVEAVNGDWHDALHACVVVEALIVRLADRLDDKGVRWRVTKGSALAHLDFPDPALRTFADIDLMIHPDDWDTVLELLVTDRADRSRALDFARRYGKGCTAMVDDMEVDLHLRFAVGRFGVWCRPDQFFESTDTFALADRTISALTPEFRALHACYHACLGGYAELRAFRDVAQLALGSPDGRRRGVGHRVVVERRSRRRRGNPADLASTPAADGSPGCRGGARRRRQQGRPASARRLRPRRVVPSPVVHRRRRAPPAPSTTIRVLGLEDVTRAPPMTPDERPLLTVGPLRIADLDVVIRTNCEDFAGVAGRVFGDLAPGAGVSVARRTVVFETVCHDVPSLHWSVRRDGEPCELELRDDAVLVHQQWELNRIAIDAQTTAVHAAAIAVSDRAALLVGKSHSGKTTLGGWCAVRQGAEYISDEVAAIDDRLRVRPFRRPLGVRSDSPLATLAPPADDATHRFMPDERLVPISELGGTARAEATPIWLVVFPRRDPSSSVLLRRLREADALERLVALTPGVVRHGSPVFLRLSRLVATTAAIELRYADVRSVAELVLAELSQAGDP